LDGEAVRSCVTPLGSAAGASVMTVEGLLENGNPGPLQRAFIEEQAAQCGYCIPGMVMSAKALLDQTPKPSEADVRSALDGNLCRCGSHNRIVRAVLRASQEA
jgi:nicotinate dehydrogenase subunit A